MFEELKNLFKLLKNIDVWKILADSKMRARYNRTVLGPLWEIIGSLFLLLLLAFLWSKLWSRDFIDFFTYLLIGYTLWRTVLSTITDANMLYSNTYIAILRNVRVHPFMLAIASAYKNIITLILNFPLIIFVLYLNDQIHITSIFFSLIFLFLFFLSSISLTFLFGILCLKYRDLEHSIGVVLGMLFFFTPIIWNVDQLGDKILFIQPNILYHYIHFFRSGLQNGSVDQLSILVVVCSTIFLLLFSCFVSKLTKNKIAYWID